MKALLRLLALIATPAIASPPTSFDARVEALRQQIGVPGMAIAIVEDGKTVLARGYGVRKLGSPDKVDADTIFMTGSTGKAFTTAALATWSMPEKSHGTTRSPIACPASRCTTLGLRAR